MHVTVKTTNFNAIDILTNYCKEKKIVFDSLIIGDRCILTIKNPNKDVLRDISRFGKSLSSMTDINISVYVDKATEPLSIEELNI